MRTIRTIKLPPPRVPQRRSEPVPIRTAVEEAGRAISARAARRRRVDPTRLFYRVRATG